MGSSGIPKDAVHLRCLTNSFQAMQGQAEIEPLYRCVLLSSHHRYCSPQHVSCSTARRGCGSLEPGGDQQGLSWLVVHAQRHAATAADKVNWLMSFSLRTPALPCSNAPYALPRPASPTTPFDAARQDTTGCAQTGSNHQLMGSFPTTPCAHTCPAFRGAARSASVRLTDPSKS